MSKYISTRCLLFALSFGRFTCVRFRAPLCNRLSCPALQEYHPDPAVELFCEESSATMKHIVVTEPPAGLWTATIKTFRDVAHLDQAPFNISFIIHNPPPLDASTQLRQTPWERPRESREVWGQNWGMLLPPGSARCASGADATVERCLLTNAMAANGTFFLWPGEDDAGTRTLSSARGTRTLSSAQAHALELMPPSEDGFSLFPCPGGDKANCWGVAAQVDIRYLADERRREAAGVCDTTVSGSAVLFSLPYLANALSALMEGFVALVATLEEEEEVRSARAPCAVRAAKRRGSGEGRSSLLLITNAAPPVEALLSPYLPLFAALTERPIVSLSELSLQGSVCFHRLHVGLRTLLTHSHEEAPSSAARTWAATSTTTASTGASSMTSTSIASTSTDAGTLASSHWWGLLQGSMRPYLRRTRLLVTGFLGLDAGLAVRYRGGRRVVLAVRKGRLNREWYDVNQIVVAAESVRGVLRVMTGRLVLAKEGGQGEGDGEDEGEGDWGDEWEEGRDREGESEREGEVGGWGGVQAAERGQGGRGGGGGRGEGYAASLVTLVGRLQNCSILIAVTGEALTAALWMQVCVCVCVCARARVCVRIFS
jgi:hypothetical protein